MIAFASFLQLRGIERPDRRPLYAYRVTADEFQRLTSELRNDLRLRHGFAPDTAAAFCLVAAEHLSRGDGSDWWSWEPIKDFVGHMGPDAELREAVRRGLAYWGRGVIRGGTGRQFLGTLVCEGGLPMRLVQEDGARLRRYFRELLREHEMYPTLDLVELAGRPSPHLPVRMQNAIVYELAADLVREVGEMRRQHATPAQVAAWRIPLRLDDDVAREFLEGLRTSPSEHHRPERGISIRTVVRLGREILLQREVLLPPKVTAAWLQRTLSVVHVGERVDEGPLPSRLYLSLEAADGARLPVAIATRDGENYIVRSTARSLGRPEVVAGQVRCIVGSYGTEHGSFVPVGAVGLPETPWIFSDEGPQGTFVSASGFRTRSSSLLLALPPGGAREVDGTFEDLGEVMGHGRRLFRLGGELRWSSDGDTITVTTGQDDELDFAFELKGRRAPPLVREADLWLGCPDVWQVPTGGVSLRVNPARLEWRSDGGAGAWRKLDSNVVGVGQLALRGKGEGFRAPTRILPSDFRVKLRNGRNGSGVVELRSAALLAAGLVPLSGISSECRKVQEGFELHLTSESPSAIPASVVVSLRLRDGGDLPITLPYPAERATFVGRDGEALIPGTRVSVDALAQLRARAVSPDRAQWSVDLRAQGGSVTLARLRSISEGVHELHLEPLRGTLASVLASDPDLDRTIELVLVREGAVGGREPRLVVRRYDLALQPRSQGSTHELEIVREDADRLAPELLASLRAEAVSMDSPDSLPVPLLRGIPGRWSVDNPHLAPGAWLVLVLQNDYLRGRPHRITIPGASDLAPATGIEAAIGIADSWERQERLREVLEGLGDDLGSAERDVIRSHLSMLGRCPAGTFDVIRAVSQNPVIAVQFLLEWGSQQSVLWDGLEELPFSWAGVSVQTWLRAIRSHVRYLRSVLPDESAVPALLETAAPGVFGTPKLAPFLDCIHEAAFLTLPGIPSPSAPWVSQMARAENRKAFLSHLDQERNGLLQRHSGDDWWPTASPFDETLAETCRTELAAFSDRFDGGPRFQNEVLMTPMLLAARMLTANSTVDLLRLRRMRAFDPEWFEFAHTFSLSFLLGQRLETKKAPFDE